MRHAKTNSPNVKNLDISTHPNSGNSKWVTIGCAPPYRLERDALIVDNMIENRPVYVQVIKRLTKEMSDRAGRTRTATLASQLLISIGEDQL